MAQVLFTTFGSYGDLYPYLAIGVRLRRLGHSVSIATSASFEDKVQSQGLGFLAVRPDIALDNREMMEYLFDRHHGTERVLREISSRVKESYEDTLQAVRNADVVVTHPIAFGAVLAARKLRKPWVSTVLAPISFLSAYDPPVPAPLSGLVKLRVFGPGVMRVLWKLAKLASRQWLKPALALEAELGLRPGGHPLFEGANSPDLVLALFSSVFAQPQPDWPQQAIPTGFPFHNSGSPELPRELERFFDSEPAPIVFTLGSSAVGAAGSFYSDSLQAVTQIDARALFLTGSHVQDLPASLPATVKTWPYAPHGPAFARAAAIVHQGGIGTLAQALASGHPSLVVPFAHDQFDNAARVRRLGCGLALPRGKYNANSAATALSRLLKQPAFDAAAKTVAEQLGKEDGAESAAIAIHTFIGSQPQPGPSRSP